MPIGEAGPRSDSRRRGGGVWRASRVAVEEGPVELVQHKVRSESS